MNLISHYASPTFAIFLVMLFDIIRPPSDIVFDIL